MLLKTICRCCLRGSWAAVLHFPPHCASVKLWNSVRKHALLSSVCYTHTSPHTGVHARRCSSSLPFICVWLWRGGFKWARMIMSMGALKRKIGCVRNTHKHTHRLSQLSPIPVLSEIGPPSLAVWVKLLLVRAVTPVHLQVTQLAQSAPLQDAMVVAPPQLACGGVPTP